MIKNCVQFHINFFKNKIQHNETQKMQKQNNKK